MTTTFLSPPPHLLPSSTPTLSGTPVDKIPPQLHCSLVPPVDKIPTHLLNSAALWYPQWTKYLLTFSPPQLHHSLVPPVDKIPTHLLPSSTPPLSGTPSGQNTSSPPPFLNSTALWYPQWTKYLLTFSTPLLTSAPSGPQPALWRPKWTKYLLTSSTSPLSGAPSGLTILSGGPSGQNTSSPPQLHHSLAPQVAPLSSRAAQVDKIPPHLLNFTTLWRPSGPHYPLGRLKWCSLTPLVALSGASHGNLLCSLALSNLHQRTVPLYTTGEDVT